MPDQTPPNSFCEQSATAPASSLTTPECSSNTTPISSEFTTVSKAARFRAQRQTGKKKTEAEGAAA